MPQAETKTIKVYRTDERHVETLRENLTRIRGKQATYADVVEYLIGHHLLITMEEAKCCDPS